MTTRPGRPRLLWRRPARVAFVSLGTVLALLPAVQANAGGYTTINGSGSSWSAGAIFQWNRNVQPQGLTVNYNPTGSAQGRADFIQGSLVDFAGSDPPFRNGQDKLGQTGREFVQWAYSYVPDTAGGTAFMYHLTYHGQLVRNLRLDPKTLMEIFTGVIKNWSDPRITHIYGGSLPNEPITPVLRADGSGATFFLTRWLSTEYPTQWNQFCQRVHPGITLPCGNTEFYPGFPGAKSESGSTAVADYITSSFGEGSIGYDEYFYAKSTNYPVVQLLNPDKYFVGPAASNVAVALTKAVIDENPRDPNFLQQNLNNVYTFTDARSYPLSSYSYLIVPRDTGKLPSAFNSSAGRSLSTYIDYFLCGGQQQMAELGYSPLPLNLVQGGLLQSSHIPGHISGPNPRTLAGCNNPTFTNGVLTLLKNAPYPSPCQKLGAPLNCVVRNGHAVAAGSGSNGGGSNSGNGAGNNSNSSANAASGAANGTGSTAGAANLTGTSTSLASNGTDRLLLAVLTALALVTAVATPPAVGAWMRRRKRQAGA